MCVRVYAFERECVRKFLENASKMNAECNTPATKRTFFYMFFLSLSFFFGKLLRRYSDSFAQAFQVRFTDIVPEILLCVRPSIDHFFFFSSFFLLFFCARKHPEDRRQVCALATGPAASRLKEPVFSRFALSHGFSYSGLLIVRRERWTHVEERSWRLSRDWSLNNFLQREKIIPLLSHRLTNVKYFLLVNEVKRLIFWKKKKRVDWLKTFAEFHLVRTWSDFLGALTLKFI